MPAEIATGYSIERLGNRHKKARERFCCGVDALDRYLREQAGQDAKRRVTATFLLTNGSDILGYYTLSATGVEAGGLPPEIAKRFPKYPLLPATLIGRLAVDKRRQGLRLGELLLLDALRRSLENSDTVGSVAVVVDAKGEKAQDFYLRYGFIQLLDSPRRLFLPMQTIAEILARRKQTRPSEPAKKR